MKNRVCGSVALLALLAANPAGARECSPEQKLCDDLPCPPCPPAGAKLRTEMYRETLEKFRVDLEAARKAGDGDAKSYDKAITRYREGIDAYRSAQ